MAAARVFETLGANGAVRVARGALFMAIVACAGCDSGDFSAAPVSAACSSIGSQCQLADGPLGVCQEAPCGPGETRPCFKCISQH